MYLRFISGAHLPHNAGTESIRRELWFKCTSRRRLPRIPGILCNSIYACTHSCTNAWAIRGIDRQPFWNSVLSTRGSKPPSLVQRYCLLESRKETVIDPSLFLAERRTGWNKGGGTIVDSRRSLDELTTFTASVTVSKHVWWIFSRARYLQIKLTEFRFGISFGFRLFRRWNSWEFSRPGEWEEATERRKDLQVFLSRFRFWYERMFRRWSANFVYFTFSFFSSSSKMKRISRW